MARSHVVGVCDALLYVRDLGILPVHAVHGVDRGLIAQVLGMLHSRQRAFKALIRVLIMWKTVQVQVLRVISHYCCKQPLSFQDLKYEVSKVRHPLIHRLVTYMVGDLNVNPDVSGRGPTVWGPRSTLRTDGYSFLSAWTLLSHSVTTNMKSIHNSNISWIVSNRIESHDSCLGWQKLAIDWHVMFVLVTTDMLTLVSDITIFHILFLNLNRQL